MRCLARLAGLKAAIEKDKVGCSKGSRCILGEWMVASTMQLCECSQI